MILAIVTTFICALLSASTTLFIVFCIGEPRPYDQKLYEYTYGRIFSFFGKFVAEQMEKGRMFYQVFICKYCLNTWFSLIIGIGATNKEGFHWLYIFIPSLSFLILSWLLQKTKY